MAREIGAIVVGVIVGFVTENPQAGFAAASLVYGPTAPKTEAEGPTLANLLQASKSNDSTPDGGSS